MAIIGMTGLPGGGKSYNAVAHQVIPALKQGRRVVTNLPLVRDELRKITPKGELVEFPTEDIAQEPERIFEYCTPGSVVILDEVWKFWPSGQKTNQVPQAFKHLIAEHRHMVDGSGRSMSIVLVTQDLADIGVFARNKVAYTFHHVKLDHVGAGGRFRVDVYRGGVTGQEPPEGRRLRSVYGKYREEVWRCYKSHTMAQSDSVAVDESGVDRRPNVWRRPSIWIGLAFVIAAPAWALTTLAGIFGADDGGALAASVASAERPPSPVPRAAAVAPQSVAPSRREPGPVRTVERERPSYRVRGYVKPEGGRGEGYAWISDGKASVQVPWTKCWHAGDGLTRCSFNGWVVTELGAE